MLGRLLAWIGAIYGMGHGGTFAGRDWWVDGDDNPAGGTAGKGEA